MRRIGHLIRIGFEWGGNVALLVQLGGPALAAGVFAGILDIPLPFQVVVFLAAFFLILAAFLAAVGEWRTKVGVERPTPSRERVGIRNRRGGKSHSTRPTFGSDLDVAIDNSDGGESTDEDATFR